MTRFAPCFSRSPLFLLVGFLFVATLLAGSQPADAMGVATLPALKAESDGGASGDITVWYPSVARESTRSIGGFVLSGAWDSAPARGNGALVILSHGSGGSATTYHDMARVLVEAGFVVASPEHDGDNRRDQSKTGPASWKQRPAEVARAIDRVQQTFPFAPILEKGRVGIYGMSAGGLTALEFSGATWSLSRLVKHCADHLEEDMRFCANREMAAASQGLDDQTIERLKEQFIQGVQSGRVDAQEYGHKDGRVKAVVAAVPAGALIDPASLRQPRVPTALISAEMDQVLAPKWHVLALESSCTACVALGDLKSGGHMSVLSPLPEAVARRLGPWAADPPGFDRASLIPLYKAVARFFLEHL